MNEEERNGLMKQRRKAREKIKQLKKQNARLTREVCNRLIANYDYSSTFKDELNKERINNIVLKEANKQLKEENYRLEHNEKVLLQREERAINYIDQVIMYKPCAREIDEELNTLIGILRGDNNEQ